MAFITKSADTPIEALPLESYRLRHIESTCLETARLHGYREIRVPVFAHTDVAAPERLALTVGSTGQMTDGDLPFKACCAASCPSGEEAEGEGRQFGAALFGASSPAAVAELVSLADGMLTELGITGYTLEIGAPKDDESRAHFDSVKKYLATMHLDGTENPTVGENLAYGGGAAFAFVFSDLGERAVIAKGGLLKQPALTDVSVLGVELDIGRVMQVMAAQDTEFPVPEKPMVYLAPIGEDALAKCMELCTALCEEGFSAQTDLTGRSLEAQMAYAERLGAKYTVVIGDSELASGIVSLKNAESGEQTEVMLDSGIIETLYDLGINDTMARLNETVSAFESLAGLGALFGAADDGEK